MTWDTNRFDDLESRVMATIAGGRPALDVPFFRFLYGPKDGVEHICIREMQKMVDRIRARGYTAESIFLSTVFIDTMKELGFLDADVVAKEAKGRSDIFVDLRGRFVREEMTKKLLVRLEDRPQSHCAVLLRVGALFPFIRISHILSNLDRVQCSIVIPYPGSKEGEMLWYSGENWNSYYRWETI
jgi:hypothetical protein